MSHLDKFRSDSEWNRLFLQEKTTLDVSELICGLMKKKGMSRLQLARKTGISHKQLSAMLNGEEGAEINIKQLSDMLYYLGKELKVSVGDKQGS